jgi:hypothetical protein
VRPGRERLVGTVQVDETYLGGRDPGVGRGKGRGDKVLTGIAVEIKEPRGYGRCRLASLADASAASPRAFVCDHVEPGATVITVSKGKPKVPVTRRRFDAAWKRSLVEQALRPGASVAKLAFVSLDT